MLTALGSGRCAPRALPLHAQDQAHVRVRPPSHPAPTRQALPLSPRACRRLGLRRCVRQRAEPRAHGACVPVSNSVQLSLRPLQLMEYPANIMTPTVSLQSSTPSRESPLEPAARRSQNASRPKPQASTISKSSFAIQVRPALRASSASSPYIATEWAAKKGMVRAPLPLPSPRAVSYSHVPK